MHFCHPSDSSTQEAGTAGDGNVKIDNVAQTPPVRSPPQNTHLVITKKKENQPHATSRQFRRQKNAKETETNFLANTFRDQIIHNITTITENQRLIADTGVWSHQTKFNGPAQEIWPTLQANEVSCPNGSNMWSTHQGILPFEGLPLAARRTHIFKNVTGSLLSLGQLIDHGCTWHSEGANKLLIKNKEDMIVSIATREGLTGLRITDACNPLGDPTTTTTKTKSDSTVCSAAAQETIGQEFNQIFCFG